MWSFINYAQEIEIKGTIIDETTKEPIEFATVQIESTKNNRLLGYGFTDENGAFEIEGDLKKETDISLVITYIGYTTYKEKIAASNNISVGQIILQEAAESLNEVVITATPPVLIKQDTIQYNASSFKTREDAVAEDLLKKLPGVSIDNEDGSIQVNGVDVTKILVNGEPFFSDNPQVAMKILSKDVIDKIEITNTRSDEENFTGSINSEETKTINITLKKKDNGNIFGNVTGGYGTDDRYELNGVVNRMYKKSLLTVLAFSNNVNKNNFSYGDDDDASSLDKSKAIKTESNVGSNYSDKFINGDRINVDYMFSDTKYDKGVRTDNTILLPSTLNYSVENSDQTTNQQIHRGNLKLINSIFDNFRLITNARFFSKDREYSRNNDSETKNEANELINNNNSQLHQTQKAKSLNSSISAIYKFEKLNSYATYKIFTTANSYQNNNVNQSETNFFKNNPRTVLRNQLTDYDRQDTRIGNSFKYGQRLGGNHVIEYEIENRNEKQETLQDVLDVDQTNNNSTNFNSSLSYDQEINVKKLQHELSYIYKKNNFYYNFRVSHLNTELDNQEFNRGIGLVRDFKDFLYSSKARYKTKNGLIFNANYRTKSIVPRYSELLTITDNTNPTKITIGNPDLDRELEHLLSLNIRFYNRKNKIYFFNRFSYTTVQDKIINKSIIDEDLITTKTFVNNSENNMFTINGSISKDFKKTPLFYNLKLKWYSSIGKNAHFVNNVAFQSSYYRFSPSLYTEFNYNDLFEVSPYYRLFLDNTDYNNDAIKDQSNTQHTFGLNVTTFAPKRFTIFNQLQYNLNPKFEKSYGRESLVWNITANYSIVPNKAKIKLTVFNILNQYNNTNRNLSESRNSTYTYDALQQYAMLSFKYIFKN
ncbi:hypothetical protein FHR24_000976 [Wenyingzhuangia heitensis]|uniref:Outer membrane receptor proteins, mostly Fe transport n=1 Tax=Wenyingzhuangia heitensis TaxID=1487859 RepID=A0ABX0UBU4_9FLAO|nr:TonB-dependent receptor [Wenyingzhuangia heitensis]NIJ44537.1 hypothetical protein [Wenyingzhuangia heitensis]